MRRLLLLNTTAPWKRVLARLSNAQKLALADNPHGSVPALLQDCLDAAVDDIVAEHVPGEVRTEESYAAALAAVRTHAATRVLVVVEAVEPVLALAAQVRRTLEALERGAASARTAATRADVRAQLDSLVRPGFVAATGVARLRDVRRYLLAMQHRLERAATNPREPVLQEQVDAVEAAYADLLESLPADAARRRRRHRHRLDGRGAAGQPVRADPRHGRPGLREAGARGHRRRRIALTPRPCGRPRGIGESLGGARTFRGYTLHP